jgi:hypothetical protein
MNTPKSDRPSSVGFEDVLHDNREAHVGGCHPEISVTREVVHAALSEDESKDARLADGLDSVAGS